MREELPRTRKEAKELDLKYYFTGEPCVNGHIDKRRVFNHTCCSCENNIRKKALSKFIHKKHQKTMSRLYHPNQMPKWANKKKIGDMILRARENGNVLDHIIPLKGRKKGGFRVCGLHCEDNLQEMSYRENDLKSYHDWPDSW